MQKYKREYKHLRVRKAIAGNAGKMRVSVFRSSQHIYAQLIDDAFSHTLCAVSDSGMTGTKLERARQVGEELAKLALSKKVKDVVFDRGGFKYHGRVAALAEGLRRGGLNV